LRKIAFRKGRGGVLKKDCGSAGQKIGQHTLFSSRMIGQSATASNDSAIFEIEQYLFSIFSKIR
jgi:hypothetical protein